MSFYLSDALNKETYLFYSSTVFTLYEHEPKLTASKIYTHHLIFKLLSPKSLVTLNVTS